MKFLVMKTWVFLIIAAGANMAAATPEYTTWSLQDTCAKMGPDEQKLLAEYSTYREFFKQENYADALPHWRYVIAAAPGFRKQPFIDGISMYESFLEKETDSTNKERLIDTILMLYDHRIKCHDEAGFVLGRKGYSMYKMRPKSYEDIYLTMKESFKIQGNSAEYFLIPTYFNYTVIQWKLKKIDNDAVLNTYDELTAIIEYNEKNNAEEGSYYVKMRDAIDQMLPANLLSCEALIARVNDRWEAEKDDTAKVSKYYYSMRMAKDSTGNTCYDSDAYKKVMNRLYEMKPTSEMAEQIAVLLFKEGRESDAIAKFNEAIELESDMDKKGSLCLNIAKILRSQDKFSQSRTYAYKALEYKPNWGEPYILVGDLYASSGSLCGPGTGFDSQVVVWAALDKYYKAKAVDPSVAEDANDKIARYSQYMPTKTDLFERGIDEGSSYTVGCWIGETTTARGRKSN